jgi:2-oxo-3-hexenedioate decarboxylase
VIADGQVEALAARVLDASDAGLSIPPITDGRPDFGLEDAYRVSQRVAALRRDRGWRTVGWKIGFTNRTIWDEYGVHAPIWAPVYDVTVRGPPDPGAEARDGLEGLAEPRIEPEIVLRLSRAPDPAMEAEDLIACIDGVAHGFEIVQSLYPAWRFRAPDTVAAFGLHGRLHHGPFLRPDGPGWARMLETFTVVLRRDGAEADRGAAANVLGGPLHALRHLVRGLAEIPFAPGLRPGDLVTTGTLTRALPVAPGERWATAFDGLPVPGLAIRFG